MMAIQVMFMSMLAVTAALMVGFTFFHEYPIQWFRRVIMPLMTPGITAAAWAIWHMGKL